MQTDCVLRGTLLGTPQIVGGCLTANTAACITPLSTIFSMTATSTRRLCAVAVPELTRPGVDAYLPNLDFELRPTSEGFYALYYKDERVTADLNNFGQLILPPSGTPPLLDFKYIQLGGSEVFQARLRGSFQVSTAVVPVFQPGGPTNTASFALGARLATIAGVDCLIPTLLSLDVYGNTTQGTPVSPPASYCVTNWNVVGVEGGYVVNYPLTSVCSDNKSGAASNVRSSVSSFGWIALVVTIILIIILIVIALSLRRKEYVHDPMLPVAVSLIPNRRK